MQGMIWTVSSDKEASYIN